MTDPWKTWPVTQERPPLYGPPIPLGPYRPFYGPGCFPPPQLVRRTP